MNYRFVGSKHFIRDDASGKLRRLNPGAIVDLDRLPRGLADKFQVYDEAPPVSTEEPKTEELTEESKTEEPKTEEPKTEEPKTEEPIEEKSVFAGMIERLTKYKE